MSNFYKNIIWGILTLIVLSLVFSSLLLGNQGGSKTISLTDLAQKISAGQVQQIKINGNDLAVKLTDNSQVTSQKEDSVALTDTLRNLGVATDTLQKVQIMAESQSGWQFWGVVAIQTLLPLLAIGFLFWLMMRQARTGVNQAFSFGRSNVRLSNFAKDRVLFGDVAGLKEAKEELIEIVDFLKNPKKFLDLGAKIPRGVLLVGQPGTGKTMLARAVAGESNVPFFSVSASEFVEMFVGVGASRIRDAFATARRAAPAILFIDEIDAVGRSRGAGLGNSNDEREQTLNQILVELDGFDRDTQVIVLAATNRPDILDPALLRPGRFDRRVILDLPDISDREEVLKIHARGKAMDANIDFRKVAVRTPGFSGADLANLMNESAIIAARHNNKTISQEDMYNAVEKVLLGPERRSRAISEHEKEITAYHEGGHALVAACLKGSDPIHKVSIISRGFAGGYTMKLPIEEQHLRTKTQFLNDMAMMMGGYAAEKIVYKDISTGASNDLKTASDLARRLVTKYGMSELGPITFGGSEELLFLGKEIQTEKNYSEAVAAKIDNEIQGFLKKAYDVAEKALTANRKVLDAIAKTLIEKETLEQDEFYSLLKPFKIKPMAV